MVDMVDMVDGVDRALPDIPTAIHCRAGAARSVE